MKDLLKLKKAMIILGMTSLVGCESLSSEQHDGLQKDENVTEETSNVRITKKDTHCIIDIADKKVIFRSCENYSWKHQEDRGSGYIELYIYDESSRVVDHIRVSNFCYYDGNDSQMLEIEEELIEEGAKVYKITK